MVVDLPRYKDATLDAVRERVLAGQRLSLEDGLALYRTRDIFTVGELANAVRERLHGRRAYYNINRHINYSNYCVLRCKFCAFYRPYPKSEAERPADGYDFSIDEIVGFAREAADHGATETHIVGGLHPKKSFEWYLDMCRAIKAACPELHLKAFTAIEIVHFTRISKPRLGIREVLTALRDAGLDSMPGGGAEIFDDRVHDEAFRAKVGEQHWFDVHHAAHELGIPSNATMLYGHIEGIEERLTHLIKLREHQDQAIARRDAYDAAVAAGKTPDGPRPAAFNCCIPLSFIPDGSEFGHLPGPTGLDDLRTLAISRLMLDNFAHIKAFWIMQSPKLSQVALNWGVDDFDGTVVWYDITKREGRGYNHQELTVEQIQRLMREAGCEPVERDSLYNVVRRDADGAVVGR
ncbi:MAG: CofH family radical SAM protein [Phycisphaerales bacterium]|nr:CofH family radical SAM protein [Phycisphaerales bacterium]